MINRVFATLSAHMTRACVYAIFLPTYSFADDPPNALTPAEVAEGWLLLFDGKNVTEWKIDGDHEIVDGILILGGKNKTRAYLPKAFPQDCEIRFQYRINEKSGAVVGCNWQNERDLLSGFSFQTLSESNNWRDSFVREYRQFRFPMGTQPVIEHPNGINGVFGRFESFWIEVPAGQKLQLRNLRWRPEPPSWIAIVGIPLLSAGLMVLFVWWRRKKWRLKISTVRADEPKRPLS